jgi:hypothetical protein
MKLIDLVGKKYGRLTVVRKSLRKKQTMWWCVCECGTESCASGINLKTGHTSSCGCLRDEIRPTLAGLRDPMVGDKNPMMVSSKARNGDSYMPSSSIWYRRAAGVYYRAKKNNILFGFVSVAEMATYLKSITPTHCPVFGVKFEGGGQGFTRWSPSIDRKDPTKGYVAGNLQVISNQANYMKRDATAEQLATFARWVLNKE